MTVIDKAKAWEMIDALVAKRGEFFTYKKAGPDAPSGCVYAYRGKPSCAVGQMMYDLKPTPATIQFMLDLDENNAGSSGFNNLSREFEDYLGVEFDEEATAMFIEFQGLQDNGEEYGFIARHLAEQFGREEK